MSMRFRTSCPASFLLRPEYSKPRSLAVPSKVHVTVVIDVELMPVFVFGAIRMHVAAAEFATGSPSLGQLATVQPKLDFASAQLISTRVRHFPVAHPETQRAVSASGTGPWPLRSPKACPPRAS